MLAQFGHRIRAWRPVRCSRRHQRGQRTGRRFYQHPFFSGGDLRMTPYRRKVVDSRRPDAGILEPRNRLCRGDPRFRGNTGRIENREMLESIIKPTFMQLTAG